MMENIFGLSVNVTSQRIATAGFHDNFGRDNNCHLGAICSWFREENERGVAGPFSVFEN